MSGLVLTVGGGALAAEGLNGIDVVTRSAAPTASMPGVGAFGRGAYAATVQGVESRLPHSGPDQSSTCTQFRDWARSHG